MPSPLLSTLGSKTDFCIFKRQHLQSHASLCPRQLLRSRQLGARPAAWPQSVPGKSAPAQLHPKLVASGEVAARSATRTQASAGSPPPAAPVRSADAPGTADTAGQPTIWQRIRSLVTDVLKHAPLYALVACLILAAPGAALARSSGGRVGGRSFGGGGGSSMSHSGGGGHGSSSRGGGGRSGGYGGRGSGGRSSIGAASSVVGADSYRYGFGYGYSSAPSIIAGSSAAAYGGTYRTETTGYELFMSSLGCLIFLVLLPAAFLVGPKRRSGMEAGTHGSAAVAPLALVRVQVALWASAREELQATFSSLAERADTSSREGMHVLLQDALLALLRRSHQFAYGALDVSTTSDPRVAERALEGWSIEERGRFSEVTRSNFRGRRRSAPAPAPAPGSPRPMDELVVVTLLVAVESGAARRDGAGGIGGLLQEYAQAHGPAAVSGGKLRKALESLGGVAAREVAAVELLWTPEAPGDTLGRDEVIEDYPHLAPL